MREYDEVTAPGMRRRRLAAPGGPDTYPYAHAETQALVATMAASPDAARKGLIDEAIGALKTAGVWAKLDLLYVLAAHHEQAARLNWVQPGSFTLVAVNGPVFTADRGFAGNGTDRYLDTGWDPATNAVAMTQNSAHVGAYTRTAQPNVGGDFGSMTTAYLFARAGTGTDARIRVTGSTIATPSSIAAPLPLHVVGVRQDDAANMRAYADGAFLSTHASASSGLSSVDLGFLRVNAGSYTTREVAAGHAGAGLSDGEVAALHTALSTFMAAVGADG